jgi:hypothetical protein
VLEALDRTPLPGEAEGGRPLSSAVLLISAVSGGSLGSVHWALGGDRYYPGLELPEQSRELVNTPIPEMEDGYRELRARTCETGPDQALPSWAIRCQPGSPSLFEPLQWPAASARADQMATDLNAPTLRGMVLPGIARGQALERFWRSHFEWRVPELRPPPAEGTPTGPPPPPLLLVNATEVHTGFRLVSGQPALPPGLLWDQGSPENVGREPSESEARYRARVYWSNLDDPDGPKTRAVSDIDPYLRVQPSESVRMSANFPWGFDLPALNVQMEDDEHWGIEDEILVVDGGVLDNTGIDAVSALLVRLDHLSASDDAPPRLRERSAILLRKLARRGVVLLEIDSGSKPQAPSLADRAMRDALMPVSALSEAAYVRERAARLEHLSTMQRVLEEQAERDFGARESERGTTRSFGAAFANSLVSAFLQREIERRLDLSPEARKCVAQERMKAMRGASAQQAAPSPTAAPALAHEVIGRRVAHVTYTANRGDNIMTAWALTPAQKGNLLFRFVFEHAIEREELLEDWQTLRGENRLLEKLEGGTDTGNTPALQRLIGQLSDDQERSADDEYRDAVALRDARSQLWLKGAAGIEERPAPSFDDGWIFLGFGRGSGESFRWETLYVESPLPLKPDEMVGRSFLMAHRMHVRPTPPAEDGDLAETRATVARGARVRIERIASWGDPCDAGTGLFFARIESEDPTAPAPPADPTAPVEAKEAP